VDQQVNYERMETHVRLLAWLLIINELLGLCIGGLVFMFFTGIGAASGEPDAARILPIVGLFALGIFTIFSLPGLLAGVGLLRRCAWARYLGMVVGFLNMFWVPIGTLIGIYTFWVLLRKDAAAYFEHCDPFYGDDDQYDQVDDGPDEYAVEEVYFHGDDEPDSQ
jgi:hypothetical protein